MQDRPLTRAVMFGAYIALVLVGLTAVIVFALFLSGSLTSSGKDFGNVKLAEEVSLNIGDFSGIRISARNQGAYEIQIIDGEVFEMISGFGEGGYADMTFIDGQLSAFVLSSSPDLIHVARQGERYDNIPRDLSADNGIVRQIFLGEIELDRIPQRAELIADAIKKRLHVRIWEGGILFSPRLIGEENDWAYFQLRQGGYRGSGDSFERYELMLGERGTLPGDIKDESSEELTAFEEYMFYDWSSGRLRLFSGVPGEDGSTVQCDDGDEAPTLTVEGCFSETKEPLIRWRNALGIITVEE